MAVGDSKPGTEPTRGRNKHGIVYAAWLVNRHIEDIAKVTGIPERTVFRYMNDRKFKELRESTNNRVVEHNATKVINYSGEAIDFAYATMHNPNAPWQQRVLCCFRLIDLGFDLHDKQEFGIHFSKLQAQTIEATTIEGNKSENTAGNAWASPKWPRSVENGWEQ